jgi:hypothetical protein
MALGLRRLLSALPALAWLGACHASSTGPGPQENVANIAPQSASAPAADTSPPSAAEQPAVLDPARSFVVRQVKRGQLLLVSSENGATRVLASASAGLLQPRLGLLWLRRGPQLQVLDLDRLDRAPVAIAEGLPEIDRFEITGQTDSIETEDGCDLPAIELDWSAEPRLASELAPAPSLRVIDTSWLGAQRQRSLRTQAERREFEDAERKTRLPAKLLSCEVKETCGATLALGALGLELVLVQQHAGGDCVHVACLLRDPKSRLFATPPHATAWGSADKTRPGTCGPYMFDRSHKHYLVGDQLCAADSGCVQLAGLALGWLEPGETVGAPGILAENDE